MSYRMTDTEIRLYTAAKRKDTTAFDAALPLATDAEMARVASELLLHIEEMGDLYATYFDEYLWALGYLWVQALEDLMRGTEPVEVTQDYQHECGRCNECNGLDDDEGF